MTRLYLFTALALVGCGNSDNNTPDAPPLDSLPPPRETITEDVLLPAGSDVDNTVEGIMTGGSGDLAVIRLTAPTATMDWNIHGHAGGGTQVIDEEFKTMSLEYPFTPSASADWYLLVRNSGSTSMTVQVKIELHGSMQWRWQE